MSSAELSKQLIEALSQQPVNILRVRSLCRSHPGLIASAGLRLKTWSILLLGVVPGSSSSNGSGNGNNNSSNKDELLDQEFLKQDIVDPIEPCGEQHVLEADVPRTRAENELFRQSDVRNYIRIILQTFCLDHCIQYKQGMNEVIAPLMALVHQQSSSPSSSSSSSSSQPQQHRLTYCLLKAILFRYLERFFCVDDSSFLFKAFSMFHLLLLYFDPQLANHLNNSDFTPEFYSPQWFLTLYARALPLPQVLRLWDMLIAVDDPSFTFFIGLCMLRRQREALLQGDTSNIPEVLANSVRFNNEEEVDYIVKEAMKLYQITPRCILRQLRLCCVSTTELTPLPTMMKMMNTTGKSFTSQLHHMRLNVEEHDNALTMQTMKKSMSITAQELVHGMLPMTTPNTDDGSLDNTLMHIPQQYVIIDIRSYEDKTISGGGTMPRAIELDPEFLNNPDAFDVWVQHFDGTRGCNICIVDLPPAQWTGIALWRRLLLGEGDSSNYGNFRNRYDFDNPQENKRRLDALIASKRAAGGDVDVRHEEELVNAELRRPAVLLAIALQTHSFPNVSVLDGGFPSLVEYLYASRGTVEPIIINHEEENWKTFLRNTGRSTDGLKQNKKGSGKQQTVKDGSAQQQQLDTPKKVKDLTELEKLRLACQVAERLQHEVTHKLILERIKGIEELIAAGPI